MQLTANNLSAKTIRKTIIDGATLSCEIGQKTAIYGGAGSGKTVLLLMLGGFLKSRSGSLYFDDLNVFKKPSQYREIVGLGEIAKANPLVEELSPRENIAFCAQLKGFKNARTIADEALNKFGIKIFADTPVAEISPLARSVTSLACAMVNNPQIFFLDEPTKMLTTREAERFWQIIDKNTTGRTLIFTTKNFDEASIHAQTTIQLEKGRIIP